MQSTDAKAAARLNLRLLVEDAPDGFQHPSEEVVAAKIAIQDRLATVLRWGCIPCARAVATKDDGSEIDCPIVQRHGRYRNASDKIVEVAEGCSVPETYATVHAGKLVKLTPRDVLEQVPFEVPQDVWDRLDAEEALEGDKKALARIKDAQEAEDQALIDASNARMKALAERAKSGGTDVVTPPPVSTPPPLETAPPVDKGS